MKPLYILHNDQQIGPFQPEDVQRLLNTGQLDPSDPAWMEGRHDWEPLQQLLPLALNGNAASPVLPLRPRSAVEEKKPRPFFLELPFAFVYPLRGPGPFLLLGATAALVFSAFVTYIPGTRSIAHVNSAILLLVIFVASYYAACIFRVIQATASGDDDMAEAPDVTSMHDQMGTALLQVVGTIIGCLAPTALALYLNMQRVIELEWLALALAVLGLAYLPMALLATAILGSVINGLNPLFVLPAIMRSFVRYIVILALLTATVIGAIGAGAWLNQRLVSFAAAAALLPIVLYLGVVQARLLGLIYKTSPNRLGWFG